MFYHNSHMYEHMWCHRNSLKYNAHALDRSPFHGPQEDMALYATSTFLKAQDLGHVILYIGCASPSSNALRVVEQ